LSLPQPLLGDTIPLSVSGDLAVALEPSGALRVQLVPGRHEIHLLARRASHVGPLKNRPRGAPWPEQEIWTFRALPELRSVELNGLVGIDASRTELPPEWRSDGAYVARADSALELVTTRRGEAQIPNNKLHFQREFWLDEAARGFTVRDTVRGSMHQGWRLNLVSGELGSVRVGGEDQVITKAQGLSGVEIRDGELDLVAVSRVPRTSELSAVG